MAALLPTILSDDEEEVNDNLIGSRAKKKQKKEKPGNDDVSDDGGESSSDEMDGDFEFGGLLVSWCIHPSLDGHCVSPIVIYSEA